jgi:sporulation protein YlmC with PRC-barrel domain
MKTTTRIIAPSVIAILCLALANWAKATDETDAPKAAASHEMGQETKSSDGTPARFNKASGIVGMDVRNQSDEHLGHIKDVVFDWKTERVSYAVISTTSKIMLGINEKLLAVPLSALTVSSDEKHLVLNADKSKVETATGFSHDNWPSVTSPTWGAQPFWQTETPGMTTKPAMESEPASKSEMKPESKPDTDLEPKPNTDPESKPDMEPETKSYTDPEAMPNTEPESNSEADSESTPDL